MMNEFSDLEAELKALRPVAAPKELHARVERELAEPSPATRSAGVLPRRKLPQWNWLVLGLGVAVAAFLVLARTNVDRTPPASQPSIAATSPSANSAQPLRALVPDGVTRVVYNTRDEGLLFPPNGDPPVRRKRAHSRETLQWRDNQSGASLRVSYPTEEVELIPVSGQ
jgi:hypothetical protein